MTEQLSTIDDVITTFFLDASAETTGVKQRRTQQVERDMRAFLEAEVESYLTVNEHTLLAAERQFDPSGAACRSLDAEVLFVALTGFLTPPYLAPDLLLRRAQLDLVDGLVGYVAFEVLREYDTSCIRMNLRQALLRARHDLKRDRREQLSARELAAMAPDQRQALDQAFQQIDARYRPASASTVDERRDREPRQD